MVKLVNIKLGEEPSVESIVKKTNTAIPFRGYDPSKDRSTERTLKSFSSGVPEGIPSDPSTITPSINDLTGYSEVKREKKDRLKALRESGMGAYYQTQEPLMLNNQDLFGQPQWDVNIGSFQSKTLGTMPIFAGGAAQVLPFAAFNEQRNILQDLLIRATMPTEEDRASFEAPTPKEVDYRYNRQYKKQFLDGQYGFVDEAKKRGVRGLKELNDPTSPLGEAYARWTSDQDVLATEINGIIDGAKEIAKLSREGDMYVPKDAIKTKNKILNGVGRILDGDFLLEDEPLVDQLRKLEAHKSLPSKLKTEIYDVLEKDIETSFVNQYVNGYDKNGVKVVGEDGRPLRTQAYKDYIIQISKTGVFDNRLEEAKASFSELNPAYIRKDGEEDFGQPFTTGQLDRYVAAMMAHHQSKGSLITVGSREPKGTTVNVYNTNNMEKPEKSGSLRSAAMDAYRNLTKNGSLYSDSGDYLISDPFGVDYSVDGEQGRYEYSEDIQIFDKLARILAKREGFTGEKVSDVVHNFKLDDNGRVEFNGRNFYSSKKNMKSKDDFLLPMKEQSNLNSMMGKISEFSNSGIQVNSNIRIKNGTMSSDGKDVVEFDITAREGSSSKFGDVSGVIIPSTGRNSTTGGKVYRIHYGTDYEVMDGVKYKKVKNRPYYKLVTSDDKSYKNKEGVEVMVSKQTIDNFVKNGYNKVLTSIPERVNVVGQDQTSASTGSKSVDKYTIQRYDGQQTTIEGAQSLTQHILEEFGDGTRYTEAEWDVIKQAAEWEAVNAIDHGRQVWYNKPIDNNSPVHQSKIDLFSDIKARILDTQNIKTK